MQLLIMQFSAFIHFLLLEPKHSIQCPRCQYKVLYN